MVITLLTLDQSLLSFLLLDTTTWPTVQHSMPIRAGSQFPPILFVPLNIIRLPHFFHLNRFRTSRPSRNSPTDALIYTCFSSNFVIIIFSARYYIFLAITSFFLLLPDYLTKFHQTNQKYCPVESWPTARNNRFVSNHNSITLVHLF